MVASALTAALAGASQLALHCQGDVLGGAFVARSGQLEQRHKRGGPGLGTAAAVSIPLAAALEISNLDGAISGSACSPPRTRNFTSTNSGLAPSFCLAGKKARRWRRPPTPGAGGGDDDGGTGDGFGGDDGDGGGWGWDGGDMGEEGPNGMSDSLRLWQVLCLCSLMQTLHYAITATKEGQQRTSALAGLSQAFYSSRPHRLRAVMQA